MTGIFIDIHVYDPETMERHVDSDGWRMWFPENKDNFIKHIREIVEVHNRPYRLAKIVERGTNRVIYTNEEA